ncbi:lymphokine-activated killer T-cell-originated protein kinase [Schistocerca gregaria]|uniref:lymphokine-activated killer T-cell-originated protein kinase n=1 Tax=Schistocerca gregaria TaxID=7010 RepID=UPI00211E3A77|nr:lymphokine-activated killer T-cell-originated protein kinase [Schistocerca gregaria]
MDTPIQSRGRNRLIPPTPQMRKIGFGTGVSVYSMQRSPCNGNERSPWAVKKLLRSSMDRSYEKRLDIEADLLKKLQHPNIVEFRAFELNSNGSKCLAMEKCEISLGDFLERCEAPLPPFIIKKVGLDIANALHYLHSECMILHGDIKSYNILIKGNFEVAKLCDFGVAQRLDENGINPEDNYIGTLLWSAPEVLPMGSGPTTSKADIFSFGLVLFEMMTLHPPHMDAESSSSPSSGKGSDGCGSSGSSLDDSTDEKLGTRPDLPCLSQEYEPIIHLFNWCTEHDLNLRPTAGEVIVYLEKC